MSAETTLPGFFEKRELLYAEQPDAAALRKEAGNAMAAGVLDVALDLFVKAGDTAGMEQVLEEARRIGDAFSFEAALRALGRTVGASEWVRLGETARAAGRLAFAYRAFEKADSQPNLERVRQEMAAAGIATER